jgi:hypothetical protein
VAIRFTDDSNLKLSLQIESIELHTPHGRLNIPLAEIRRVEFATRIPADAVGRVDSAVAGLGSDQFRVREAAMAELRALGEKAYPSLLQAAMHKDPETVRRADALLKELRDTVGEELLVVRKHDVVYTRDSKITGRIDMTAFKATTAQFGEVQVKLSDIYSLEALGVDAGDDELVAGKEAQVESGGVWYAAEVKEVKAGQYHIHYVGWSPAFDEWVGKNRIRFSNKKTSPGAPIQGRMLEKK